MSAVLVRIIETCVVYCACLPAFDYGSYYQATIFSTLDGSGRGMDKSFRNPSYHLLPHWILWVLAVGGLISSILAFAYQLKEINFGALFAILVSSYFGTRYLLMRRGIS